MYRSHNLTLSLKRRGNRATEPAALVQMVGQLLAQLVGRFTVGIVGRVGSVGSVGRLEELEELEEMCPKNFENFNFMGEKIQTSAERYLNLLV